MDDDSTSPASIDTGLRRKLDRMLEKEQHEKRLPSVVVALVRDGRIVWSSSRGTTGAPDGELPTTDTQYRIGSISKTFVAVEIMRNRDEGALDLSDRIGSHIEELADLPVTIAQLMSHTSGLRAETAGDWWERVHGVEFAALAATTLRPEDLLWRPGRRFHYSNPGFAVLGELVARKRGVPFGDALREQLWQPLGMSRTSLRPEVPYAEGLAVHPHAELVLSEPEHDAVAMAPAGQLWSTLDDLAKWSQVLAGDTPQVLSAETADEMIEPIGITDIPGEAWTGAYGLGLQLWNETGRRRFGHLGAMPGHWAVLYVDSATKDAVVGCSNTTYKGLRLSFFDELLDVFHDESPRPVTPFATAAGPIESSLMELTGTWYWGPVEHRINIGADGCAQLRGVPAPGRDTDFQPSGEGTFAGKWGYFTGETLAPIRAANGALLHIDIASYVFTRTPYDPSVRVPGGIDASGWRTDTRTAP